MSTKARERPSHRCTECGTTVAKWVGRCPECQAWGSILEQGVTRVRLTAGPVRTAAQPITSVSAEESVSRPTGVSELDRVLGGGIVPGSVILLAGEPGVGKALALDTALPTAAGTTTMEDVKVGDRLFAPDGSCTTVVAVGPLLTGRPCFEITFSDHTRIVADAEHEWLTSTRNDRLHDKTPAIRTTREIADSVRFGYDDRLNHSVDVAAPLQLDPQELPVPPYTLGAWLGDGTSAGASFTTQDFEILYEMMDEGIRTVPQKASMRFGLMIEAPARTVLANVSCVVCSTLFTPKVDGASSCSSSCAQHAGAAGLKRRAPACAHCTRPLAGFPGHRGLCRSCRNADLLPGRLRALGVLGNKHIPMAYLRASEEQRRALLAGLLDTDGTVSRAGVISLGLTSERLSADAYELITSLGYRAQRTQKRVRGRREDSSTFYLTTFVTNDPVFRLARKAARLGTSGSIRPTRGRRYITSVTPVASVPVRCIQVDHPSQMYLATRSMIPTHNSTLLLEAASRGASADSPTLYVTGEESAAQVRLRAGRTGALNEHLWVAAETDLSAVLAHIDAVQPRLLVVDSVQTIATAEAEGSAGGVTQIRAVAAALIGVAKERGLATILVGHVTKDGSIAGPRLLEHLVDVVLHFEGDRHSSLRLVRAVKNRYGAADEIGCFQMTETGIEGLADPSGLFLSRGDIAVPGTCVTVTVEGRRPLLAEVQALVTKASREGSPRRAVSGLESGRVSMVLAVAEKRAGASILATHDVHTATVGGVRVTDPGADLALLLAVHSASSERPMPGGLVAIGEVGLSGEVRPVTGIGRRLQEAARLGFTAAVVPTGSGPAPDGMKVLEVLDVDSALRAVNALTGRARRTVPKP